MIKNLLKIKLENVSLIINILVLANMLVNKYTYITYSDIERVQNNWMIVLMLVVSFISYKAIKEIRNELKKNN